MGAGRYFSWNLHVFPIDSRRNTQRTDKRFLGSDHPCVRNFLDGAESAPKPEKRPQTPRETREIEAEKQALFWHFWGKPKSMPISRVRFDAF